MRESEVPASLAEMECPEFEGHPWVTPSGKPRVSIISTAGLMHRGDRPFSFGGADYRILDCENPADIVMSHISTNFDRTGFAQDIDVVFPIDRLIEMANDGTIGSVSRYHYSFMGATAPDQLEIAARQLARVLRQDEVDTALLVPV
ncbi:MAG: glycine/sarcosine/betaine reductase selenoprotein B family protein [Pseudomonadales bacterium]|jgi:D-proline reductase (dithiol) PrdB